MTHPFRMVSISGIDHGGFSFVGENSNNGIIYIQPARIPEALQVKMRTVCMTPESTYLEHVTCDRHTRRHIIIWMLRSNFEGRATITRRAFNLLLKP